MRPNLDGLLEESEDLGVHDILVLLHAHQRVVECVLEVPKRLHLVYRPPVCNAPLALITLSLKPKLV